MGRRYQRPRARARTPLGHVRRDLRRGVDVRTALRPALGEKLTAELLSLWTKAHITTGKIGAPRNPAGAPNCDKAPLRTEDRDEVKAQALFFITVLEQAYPGSKRVWTKRLWLGREGGKTRTGMVQAYVDRGRRQLSRYGRVLEAGGIFKRRQPPTDATTPLVSKTSQGRAYNCYYFQFEPPRELVLALQRDRARAEGAAQTERMAPDVPENARRAPRTTRHSAALADELLQRFRPPD